MLEPPFAIIITSLPIIKPLIAELAPTFITRWNSSRSQGPSSKAARCKPDGGHQETFHRLEEGVYSLKAAQANVLIDRVIMGDDPNDQHHYNEADVVEEPKASRV